MNKENLIRMAEYIATIPQENFNMFNFRVGNERDIECNSVGCVIGHCTILDRENILENYLFCGDISFTRWSFDFTSLNNDEWLWCFGSAWFYVDNTPEGASKRIMYLIENGLPENWRKQRDGLEPLCYK